MPQSKLSDFAEATAKQFNIPGVAVGVWASGKDTYACHCVTSVENPLLVDQDTLFLVASVTKTFTATTLGALKGQRGFFSRDKSGAVVGVDLGGRLFSRVQ